MIPIILEFLYSKDAFIGFLLGLSGVLFEVSVRGWPTSKEEWLMVGYLLIVGIFSPQGWKAAKERANGKEVNSGDQTS